MRKVILFSLAFLMVAPALAQFQDGEIVTFQLVNRACVGAAHGPTLSRYPTTNELVAFRGCQYGDMLVRDVAWSQLSYDATKAAINGFEFYCDRDECEEDLGDLCDERAKELSAVRSGCQPEDIRYIGEDDWGPTGSCVCLCRSEGYSSKHFSKLCLWANF